jgi:hypothetical protein
MADEETPSLPPDVPKGSAEARRLLKELAEENKKVLRELAQEQKELLQQAQKAADEVSGAIKQEILDTIAARLTPKPSVPLPKDVPKQSAEARRIRKKKALDDTSNNLIGKRIYKAPIKYNPFEPQFDNQPTIVHSVG